MLNAPHGLSCKADIWLSIPMACYLHQHPNFVILLSIPTVLFILLGSYLPCFASYLLVA